MTDLLPGKPGLEILSFTIKDVVDFVNYLESLGKSQTATVVRDADIGKAEASRDSGVEVGHADGDTGHSTANVVLSTCGSRHALPPGSTAPCRRVTVSGSAWKPASQLTRPLPTRSASTSCNRCAV